MKRRWLILLAFLTLLLTACPGAGSPSSNWDNSKWDEAQWQ